MLGKNFFGVEFQVDDEYEILGPLGKGSYGIVTSARHKQTKEKVAIKRIAPMASRTSQAKRTLREIRLLKCLAGHPNIVSLKQLRSVEEADEVYLVMDLMDTDLHKVIQSSQVLTESHHKFFLHQILRGVKYMHDHRILHRDLKPGNLLVTKNCTLKIADFGLARKMPEYSTSARRHAATGKRCPPMTDHVVTRWYRPPELMLQQDGYYTGAVDMWSVGCIFAEMLARKPLFPGKNFVDQLTLIFNLIGTPSAADVARVKSSQAQRFLRTMTKKKRVPLSSVFPHATSDAIDLLDKMLQFNPSKRITVTEALQHPYMHPLDRRYKVKSPTVAKEVDFDFETGEVTKEEVRRLILEEVLGREDTNETAEMVVKRVQARPVSATAAFVHKTTTPQPQPRPATAKTTTVDKTISQPRRKISLKPPIPKFSEGPSKDILKDTTNKDHPADSKPPKSSVPQNVQAAEESAARVGTKSVLTKTKGKMTPLKRDIPEVLSQESSNCSSDHTTSTTVQRKSSGGSAEGMRKYNSTPELSRPSTGAAAVPMRSTQAKPAWKDESNDQRHLPRPNRGHIKRKSKKLTVPISPKFSTMSWQKKGTRRMSFVDRKREATTATSGKRPAHIASSSNNNLRRPRSAASTFK